MKFLFSSLLFLPFLVELSGAMLKPDLHPEADTTSPVIPFEEVKEVVESHIKHFLSVFFAPGLEPRGTLENMLVIFYCTFLTSEEGEENLRKIGFYDGEYGERHKKITRDLTHFFSFIDIRLEDPDKKSELRSVVRGFYYRYVDAFVEQFFNNDRNAFTETCVNGVRKEAFMGRDRREIIFDVLVPILDEYKDIEIILEKLHKYTRIALGNDGFLRSAKVFEKFERVFGSVYGEKSTASYQQGGKEVRFSRRVVRILFLSLLNEKSKNILIKNHNWDSIFTSLFDIDESDGREGVFNDWDNVLNSICALIIASTPNFLNLLRCRNIFGLSPDARMGLSIIKKGLKDNLVADNASDFARSILPPLIPND
ncbi:MAG: hypothetical protein LBJ71_04675 [Holosporaceae bacterium]|nr:hypothetical protein [Holosporaceae bacterium]